MARSRKIKPRLKERLIREAGGKCANPGCHALRTHFHHIKEWASYQTHNAEDMIAVCPNCHDAIHYGKLPINDETIYEWKKVARPSQVVRDFLYVEPSKVTKVLLGSICVEAPETAVIFDLSPNNHLKFRIVDDEILMLDLKISSISGKEFLKITQNHLTHKRDSSIEYKQVPGEIQILVPNNSEFIPEWAIKEMQKYEPNFGTSALIPIVDIKVVRSGVVRVQGIWAESNYAIISTLESFAFILPKLGSGKSVNLKGHGEESIIKGVDFVNKAIFSVQ